MTAAVKVHRCGLCGVLVAFWKLVCFRCETAMSEGWPEP